MESRLHISRTQPTELTANDTRYRSLLAKSHVDILYCMLFVPQKQIRCPNFWHNKIITHFWPTGHLIYKVICGRKNRRKKSIVHGTATGLFHYSREFWDGSKLVCALFFFSLSIPPMIDPLYDSKSGPGVEGSPTMCSLPPAAPSSGYKRFGCAELYSTSDVKDDLIQGLQQALNTACRSWMERKNERWERYNCLLTSPKGIFSTHPQICSLWFII